MWERGGHTTGEITGIPSKALELINASRGPSIGSPVQSETGSYLKLFLNFFSGVIIISYI